MSHKKNIISLIETTIPPIHKAGHGIIIIFAIITLIMGMLWAPLGWLGAIATLWCVYFFRDPNRVPPLLNDAIIAPADGRVEKIELASLPEEVINNQDKKYTRVSIFLNIFDVHVNRIPVSGTITELHYHPGKFLSANLDKASTENERQVIVIKTELGQEITCVQIAGLVARRIICSLKQGQSVVKSEKYGIIRFGSRVDIYLPDGINPIIREGQRTVGGETVIAFMQQDGHIRPPVNTSVEKPLKAKPSVAVKKNPVVKTPVKKTVAKKSPTTKK